MGALGITMDDGRTVHLLRLLHLASPSLPTGAFAYSQGLEWAVENGWVKDNSTLKAWLADLIKNSVTHVDIPILKRMYEAACLRDASQLAQWAERLLAMRESRELRLEEKQRGRALATLLEGLQVPITDGEKIIAADCQLTGFALAAARWRIPIFDTALGYLWSWLENQVLAGIKAIPLGQTEGHQILLDMDRVVGSAVKTGLILEDDAVGASNPALAIASMLHETQYTRIYRS